MYSMILMAALTTTTDVPDFGRRGGGCCGCYGGGYGGYARGGWGGCYGGYGGWGGCYGGGWGGGWGGCYGGYAMGCYGGWGGWGGYGYGGRVATMGYPMTTVVSSPLITPTIVGTPWNTMTTQSAYFNPGSNVGSNNQATIIVHLPAAANLTIDGAPTQSRSDVRTFVSPPLDAGKTYHYNLRAEMDRNGEKVHASQNVQVRAGKTSEVYLEFPGQSDIRDSGVNGNLNRSRNAEEDQGIRTTPRTNTITPQAPSETNTPRRGTNPTAISPRP
jgi:uncharacterized protein (TIGR03000 family)